MENRWKEVANPHNPLDHIGLTHNELLDYMFENSEKWVTRGTVLPSRMFSVLIERIGELQSTSSKEQNPLLQLARRQYMAMHAVTILDSKVPLKGLCESIGLSEKSTLLILQMDEQISKAFSRSGVPHAVSSLIAIEEQLLKEMGVRSSACDTRDILTANPEAVLLLGASSVARFSIGYWTSEPKRNEGPFHVFLGQFGEDGPVALAKWNEDQTSKADFAGAVAGGVGGAIAGAITGPGVAVVALGGYLSGLVGASVQDVITQLLGW